MRFLLFLLFLSLLCGRGKAETGISQKEEQGMAKENIYPVQSPPRFLLYYASVACSCTMARCQAALALCDSMRQTDSAFDYKTIDVYEDTLAADSVAVWEVPVLIALYADGRERGRVEWDITAEDIHRLLQKGETK
ncbi:MAG: hypothetical protein FJY66_01265 [Calditrichaeota bacterium]|nr:hypothetical protein [Calditrichota bacterium]